MEGETDELPTLGLGLTEDETLALTDDETDGLTEAL